MLKVLALEVFGEYLVTNARKEKRSEDQLGGSGVVSSLQLLRTE